MSSISHGITVKTVGGIGANYATLKAAFDAINSGAISGAISLQITGNTVETASAVLNSSGGSANYTSVNIYPTISGYSISGTVSGPLISLLGADNVTFDGRVNQTGNTADLTIVNLESSNSNSRALQFTNDATNNIIQYCVIKSGAAGYIIYFANTNGTSGNDNNTIDHCNLTNNGTRPAVVIYSAGLSTNKDNSGITISNNNIYNFYNAGVSSSGIYPGANSSAWTIQGNSLYETSPFVPTASVSCTAINVYNGSGKSFLVSGNYIGGSSPQCSGSAWTVNASTYHYFCGINVTVDTTSATASIVQNNIIKNMDYTSVRDNPWDGIFINAGAVNVIGNTIGAATGNGSIIITAPCAVATTTINGGSVTAINLIGGGSGYTTAPVISFTAPPTGGTAPTATASITGGVVTTITLNTSGSGYSSAPAVIFDIPANGYSTSHGMIQNSQNTVNISNNTIGSVTTIGSSYYSHSFESIYVRTVPTKTTFTNNLIGSLTTSNSIYASSTAVSSLTKQDVYGIYSSGTGITTITGNTIANLTNGYTGTNSSTRTRGIQTIGGSNTIQNNTVRNISSSSKQALGLTSASVIGISQISTTALTTQIITGNTINNLSNTSPTATVYVSGIYYLGPTNGNYTISDNFIQGLTISSSDLNSCIKGIDLNTGSITCSNNIINLSTGLTNGYKINGIWDESGASNLTNIYFNTVYIGGTVAAGTTSNTAALWNQNNSSTRNYRNNVLFNTRSGGTTGKHYAIHLAGTTGMTIDYNDYYSNGTSGILGYLNADKSTLALWKTATSQDANSLNSNPGFINQGGTSATDYYTTVGMPGVSVVGITTDYTGNIRSSTPKMGALERTNYTWKGSLSNNFATAANWLENDVPTGGENITFDVSPANNLVLDQNRTVGDITNAQSTYKIVVSGKQLTINKNLNFTNNAQIDASASSSVVVFSGSADQNIPAGALVNNTVYDLIVNNTTGLTLNSNLTTVSHNLTINSGKKLILAPGKHLTVSGTLTNSAGTIGLIIHSDATGTASLITNSSVSGTVERFISNNYKWHFLASPVAAQPIWPEFAPAPSGNPLSFGPSPWNWDFYYWNPNANTASQLYWVSLRQDNTGTYNSQPVDLTGSGAGYGNAIPNFTVGRGYLASYNAGWNPATGSPQTHQFSGTLNSGTITKEIINGENTFNLVGNPYPSAIDWKAPSGWVRNNLATSNGGYDYWIFNDNIGNYGVYNSSSAGDAGTNGTTRNIASMQGFFVQANSSGTLSTSSAVQVHATQTWLKDVLDINNSLRIKLSTSANSFSDEMILEVNPANENGGSLKFMSMYANAPELYSIKGGQNYSIDRLPAVDENSIVAIGIKAGVNANYTFDVTGVDNFFFAKSILLEDLKTAATQELKNNPSYTFSAAPGDNPERFHLHFAGPFGINNPQNQSPFNIFSSDGSVIIKNLSGKSLAGDISVSNILGQTLIRKKLTDDNVIKIDLNAPAGCYIVTIVTNNQSFSKKVFIQ